MSDWFVTFGQQYPREPHPTLSYAHRDGWIRVVAETDVAARAAVVDHLGDRWSMLYSAEEFADDRVFYPLGELGVARPRLDSGAYVWVRTPTVEEEDWLVRYTDWTPEDDPDEYLAARVG